MTYRGAPEEWSTKYHFMGDAPADDDGWGTLTDAIANLELPMYGPHVEIVKLYGYDDTDNDATWISPDYTDDYPGSLLLSDVGDVFAAGDQAGWVRWKTEYTNSHGRPVYLRKYFHGVAVKSSTSIDSDAMSDTWQTNAAAFAAAVFSATGDWPGLSDPHHNAPTNLSSASTWVTTRTLKRRGRRPT